MMVPLVACRVLAALAGAALVALPAAYIGDPVPGRELAFELGFVAPLYATGVFALIRRPDLPIARLLAATGSVWALFSYGENVLRAVVDAHPGAAGLWLPALILVAALSATFALSFTLLALFPDGRWHGARERRVVWSCWAVALAVPLLVMLADPRIGRTYLDVDSDIANPLVISPLRGIDDLPETLFGFLATFAVPAGIVLLALRFRRLGPAPRAQVRVLLRVVLVGILVVAGFGSLALLGGGWLDTLFLVVGYAALALVPVAILVAILRYRLLDVDVLIRRSLVYGTLWLLIAGVYAGTAAGLGIAAGQRLPVTLAIVLTVLATIAFQPARRRLEGLADRWVFGERIGRYELLAAFGAELERTADTDELLSRLAETARRGLDAEWARIALGASPNGALAPRATSGIGRHTPAAATLAASLVATDGPVGVIELGPRRDGTYGDGDRSLLDTLARQAALAVRTVGLAEELAASRARIVHAQESERRRIERNIHDGVQQELVALIAKLRLARNQLERDDSAAGATLAELQHEAGLALEDLRELAQGIHPSVLTDRGLVSAIESRGRTLPVPVTVRADPGLRETRFTDDVEGAAYFAASEAIANALKHARATRVTVRIAYDGGRLSVEVADDGIGFAQHDVLRRGLADLEDRLAALGGRLSIESTPGSGTTTRCELVARRRESADV
jgi:signal transduction histidine kinase